MSVDLVTQYAKRMYCVILSNVPSGSTSFYPPYLIKCLILGKTSFEHKTRALIFSTSCLNEVIPLCTDYIFTYLLTYSMVQSLSWEANWFAASQEIPRISRNPNDHYRTHKCPPPVSILGQPNPVHIPTSHLLEIHPNITHPSKPRSPQWSPSLRLLILYIHFINIYFHQHNYIIKSWVIFSFNSCLYYIVVLKEIYINIVNISLQLWNISCFQKTSERYYIINLRNSSCKVSVILVRP